MSTQFDSPVEVKTEIEEPPSSDEDTFFSSINSCDVNSQKFGGVDGDGDVDSGNNGGRGDRSLRKRKIKRETLAESSEEEEKEEDHDYYLSQSEEEDDEWGKNKNRNKGRARQQPVQIQKKKTTKRNESKKCGGGDTTSPPGGGKRRTAMSPEEKKERERERKRLFRLREKEKRELASLVGEEEEVEGLGEEEEKDEGKVKRKMSSVKRKVSEMTEEEKEHKRTLWRQQAEKKRTAMSPEEKRERERERKRLFRLREKQKREEELASLVGEEEEGRIKKEVESLGEDEEEEESKGKVRRRMKISRISGSGGGGNRKKKVSEMTEEEKEHKRALWRQQAEKKRARRRELQGKEKQRRGGNRKPKPLTPELLEHRRLQRNKWIRDYRNRVKKDPEKWQRFKEKDSQNRKMNRMRKKTDGDGAGGVVEEVTEEERERRRMADYFRKQARLAGMTEEEKQRRREELREKNRLKWAKIKAIPGEYEKIQEKRRRWRENLSEEKKERFLEKLRENARKQHERLRKDPEKWQELKERWRVKRAMRKVELEAGAEKKKWEWSEAMKKKFEEREREGNGYLVGRRGAGMVLTEEENQKRLELRRLADKKRSLKKKVWMQGLLDEGMSIEQIMQQTETPEHRSHRLSVQRIAKAKRDLRKRLQKFGAPVEEIQQKVIELEQTYQPCKEINRYRQSWKRVDPQELEELEEKLRIEMEKFNEFLKSNRASSVHSTNTTTPSTSTASKILFSSSSSGKLEILKNRSQHRNFPQSQAPSTISNSITPAHPSPIQTQISQPATFLPNPYLSHQDFLHQFSFNQSQPLPLQAPSSHFYPQTSSTSTTTPYNTSHSLQNILQTMDMKYQQDNPEPPSYPPEYSSSSSHHGYNSTYGDEDDGGHEYSAPPSPSSSPPTSSRGNSYPYHHQPVNVNLFPPQQNPPQFNIPSSFPSLVSGKRPRAKRKSTAAISTNTTTNRDPNLKYQSQPRTKRDQVIRDMICDQCGKSFNNQYIRAHKKIYHNPHYEPKSRTCLLCNTKFPMSTKWYQHYVRDHLKKGSEHNNIVCDLCGKKFKSILNYNKHAYFTHGDGLKQENRKKCPVCPDNPGRYFKENSSLQGHIARFHPGHSWSGGNHRCWRCSEDCRNAAVLRQHVKDSHADSYFCCEFCGIMKYSQLSINFHLSTGRCLKMPKGWGKNGELRRVEDCDYISLDKAEIPCEICEKRITVKSLMKHYRLVHNVVERQDWRCLECGKEYKRREGMVVHMEEAHGRRVDKDGEMMEEVRRLNQENREGLRIERKKKEGWGKKRKMEWGEWDEEEERRKKERKGRRRRIKVICEEDGEYSETEDNKAI